MKLDSDSWCSNTLYVCMIECYAHDGFTLSVIHLL
jgi:hypothetical protein